MSRMAKIYYLIVTIRVFAKKAGRRPFSTQGRTIRPSGASSTPLGQNSLLKRENPTKLSIGPTKFYLSFEALA
jgi:hypothetical protein